MQSVLTRHSGRKTQTPSSQILSSGQSASAMQMPAATQAPARHTSPGGQSSSPLQPASMHWPSRHNRPGPHSTSSRQPATRVQLPSLHVKPSGQSASAIQAGVGTQRESTHPNPSPQLSSAKHSTHVPSGAQSKGGGQGASSPHWAGTHWSEIGSQRVSGAQASLSRQPARHAPSSQISPGVQSKSTAQPFTVSAHTPPSQRVGHPSPVQSTMQAPLMHVAPAGQGLSGPHSPDRRLSSTQTPATQARPLGHRPSTQSGPGRHRLSTQACPFSQSIWAWHSRDVRPQPKSVNAMSMMYAIRINVPPR